MVASPPVVRVGVTTLHRHMALFRRPGREAGTQAKEGEPVEHSSARVTAWSRRTSLAWWAVSRLE